MGERTEAPKDSAPKDSAMGRSALPRALRYGRVKVTYSALVRYRCPYAKRTLSALLEATGELRAEGRLEVAYIMRPELAAGGCPRHGDNAHRGFCAPHGKAEIEGAIAQLCAAKLARDREAWRRFLGCSLDGWTSAVPWRRCAGVARIAAKELATCIQGAKGEALLRASMKRAKLGRYTGSPTLLINGQRHSGGRDRFSLLRAGCERDASMAVCSKLPKVVKVKAIVLTDKRCKTCSHKGMLRNLRGRFFPGLKLRVVDYGSAEGKKLYASLKLKLLPAWLFDKGVEQTKRYDRIKRWMKPAGPFLAMRFPARWDPTAEICDNGKDDTGNGKVDCQDATCSAKLICRKAKPRRVDLFMMSRCPFANRALLALETLLGQHPTLHKRLQLQLHYIVSRPKGTGSQRCHRGFCALYGAEDVKEDMRQLCAAKLYGKKKKYLHYVFCRARDYRSNDWRICADKGISAKRIARCVKRRGAKLLAESHRRTQALNVKGSPTWLSNNKRKFSGIKAKGILDNFCKDNYKEAICRGRKP